MVSSLVAGVEVNFSESTAALVNVSTDAGVTFWASRLESVNAWNLSSIVGLGMQTGQALFSDFNAIGCNAASALITLQPDISVDAEDSRTVQIQNSSFSKSVVRAVYCKLQLGCRSRQQLLFVSWVCTHCQELWSVTGSQQHLIQADSTRWRSCFGSAAAKASSLGF